MAWKPSNFWYRLLDFWSLWKKVLLSMKMGLLGKSDTKLIDQVVYWFPFLCLTHELDLLYCVLVFNPHFCVSVWEFPAKFSEKNVFLKEQQQTLSRWWTLCNQTHICSVLKKSGKKLSKSGETSLLLGVNKFLRQVRRLILCTYSNDNDSHA